MARGVRVLTCLAVWVVALMGLALPTSATEFGTGRLPRHYDPGALFALAPTDEIRLEGHIDSPGRVMLVLRIDDAHSWSYASRFNEERELPAGPFRWTIPANGLRSINGRLLDIKELRRAFVFVARGEGTVTLTRWETGPAPQLPSGVKGYALGNATAPLPSGFERIAPGDGRITATRVFPMRRSAPDPLVANGIRGLTRLELAAPPGRVRVTLWTEDPGEWELMPHPLQRRIMVNGTTFAMEKFAPRQWIAERYLARGGDEHGPADDAWTAYGRHRGGRLSGDVAVGPDGKVTIELAGDSAEALHLAAVVIEPEGSTAGVDAVEAERADWYRSRWPVVSPAPRPPVPMFLLTTDPKAFFPEPIRVSTAPGVGARASLSLRAEVAIANPKLSLVLPDTAGITGRIWAGQWRLERRFAGVTVLTLEDNTLSPDTSRPIRPDRLRNYELWFAVPEGTPAGIHKTAVVVEWIGGRYVVPIEIEVLSVVLPKAAKPAGFYLDEAPHLTWFNGMADARRNQIACDLDLMAGLGLDGGAPAMATPDSRKTYLADLSAAARAGIAAPWLVYTPAKRLLIGRDIAGSAAAIAEAEAELKAQGIVPPVWSIADEPSNADHLHNVKLPEWVSAIRAAVPNVKLAGQLNNPKDRALLGLFDVAIINEGYGLDLDTIAATTDGRATWLYNTGFPRLTAGLWLWKSAATRYVQWHARMPTANPYDPIDGREGDVSVILPVAEECPAQPTIHRDLLDMADGVVDQRWLLWLARQESGEAKALAARLKGPFAERWKVASDLPPAALLQMRESIIEVARH